MNTYMTTIGLFTRHILSTLLYSSASTCKCNLHMHIGCCKNYLAQHCGLILNCLNFKCHKVRLPANAPLCPQFNAYPLTYMCNLPARSASS